MARKHNTDEVLKSLDKKRDCYIHNGIIEVLFASSRRAQHDLGNGSWGKIDYLVKYCGFTQIFVKEFSKL